MFHSQTINQYVEEMLYGTVSWFKLPTEIILHFGNFVNFGNFKRKIYEYYSGPI